MKTILYGAFGRHNFGDLLFPHIVHKLIKENINESEIEFCDVVSRDMTCLLYTSPSPRDGLLSRMPSSA